jgi:WD40 repeat protein
MDDYRRTLERARGRYAAPDLSVESIYRRHDRKRRRERVAAGVVGLVILVGVVVAGASVLSSRPSPTVDSPTPPALAPLRQPNEVVLLTGGAGGKPQRLVAADVTTGEQRPLATCAEPCVLFGNQTWSPQGTFLSYEVVTCVSQLPCEPEAGLWIVDVRGPRQLTSTSVGQSWSWAPDDSSLAYGREDRPMVSLLDPLDGTLTPLVDAGGDVTAMAWSPDGERIAFATAGGIVATVAPDGTGLHEVATGLVEIESITWSPDSSTLALDTFDGERSLLVVVPLDGSDPKVVAEGPGDLGPFLPAWQPQGTRLAYVTTPRDRGYRLQVWTIDPDGSHEAFVYDGGCCGASSMQPVWSPNGDRVAFVDEHLGSDWLVAPADGTGGAEPLPTLEAEAWRQHAEG